MIGTILQGLSCLLIIISLKVTSGKKSLLAQAFSCLITSISSFWYSAVTAGTINLIGFVRTLIFRNNDKYSKAIKLMILLVFQIINIIATIITWDNWLSGLASFNTLFRTYCLWTGDIKIIKFSGIEMGLVLAIHYFLYDAYILAIIYFFILLLSIYESIKILKNNSEIKE